MQIGDTVRFLNEVGGGVVAGFQGKDIVLVTDKDGFDIPMLRSQVVVVETNENNRVINKNSSTQSHDGANKTTTLLPDDSEEPHIKGMRKEEQHPKERKGGEEANVSIAFVPENSRELSTTRFEAYLINDSNYFMDLILAKATEGGTWELLWHGTLEPNTKQMFETFEHTQLNDIENIALQAIAWKRDKTFVLQPTINAQRRLELVKFFKLHTFQPTPYFREPALVWAMKDSRHIDNSPNTGEDLHHNRENGKRDKEQTEAPNEETKNWAKPMSREEEREALKAAKRALKEEIRAQREQERAKRNERDPHTSKPNRHPEKETIIEIDLHINALLDHTEGLSPSVLLNTQLTEFRIMMDRNIKKKGQRIVFIHGKGEGVLREAIIKELQHRYRSCTYEDASFQKYGYGATMVTIH